MSLPAEGRAKRAPGRGRFLKTLCGGTCAKVQCFRGTCNSYPCIGIKKVPKHLQQTLNQYVIMTTDLRIITNGRLMPPVNVVIIVILSSCH